jgi:hypothetical protein
MSVILLSGSLSFENYSQTQIKLTFDSGYSVTDYFFDKRSLQISLPDDPFTGEQLYIIPGVGPRYPNYFQFVYSDVILPATTSSEEFRNIINSWLYTGGPQMSVNGGTLVGPLNAINLIEGTNITISAVDNISTNSVDVTIDSSGGGGGLPPDGTYGDVVVSGSGTVWTVTDDTSNQQVAVYEDGFIRGTRPALNFFDDGGAVSVTITDDAVNNRVDIGISTLIPAPAPVYLVAHSETTQVASVRNTENVMQIERLDENNDISIVSTTQITFAQDGVYNIQFSAQFTNIDSQSHDVDVWFKKNGSSIAWSNSRCLIPGTHGGGNGHYIAAWNFMATFSTGDYVELYWQTDDVQAYIESIPTSFDAPDTPSIILTVDKL